MDVFAILFYIVAVLSGNITYYNDGIMDNVYSNRLAWHHVQPCDECIGFMATADSENLGKLAYVLLPDADVLEGPFLIIDCAASHDKPAFQRNGHVAEVDWLTSRRWNMSRPIPDAIVLILDFPSQ